MNRKWKKMIVLCCTAVLTLAAPAAVMAQEESPKSTVQSSLAASARSAILMDADSGTIIYEKNSHDRLPPASITKVMTMLLIMEALDEGKIKLTDKVSTSEYALLWAGRRLFLSLGEQMSVDEMLKGIALASGNDTASVAMAEKIAGTEAEFVNMMNKRAEELGLKKIPISPTVTVCQVLIIIHLLMILR